eukprot:gene30030-52113_t
MLEVVGAATAPSVATASASAAPSPVAAPVAGPAAVAAAPAPAASTGRVEVHVPDIGDFKDVSVIEVFVKPGDTIKVEQSLVTVESDKAAMEIPSSAAGVLKELKVKVGDKINIGDLLAILEGTVSAAAAPVASAASAVAALVPAAAVPAAALPAAVAATTPVASAVAVVAAPAHAPGAPTLGLPHASPSVRKFARELGVPLAEVKGSGPKGRITDADVQNFTRSVMSGAVQTLAAAAQNKGAASAGDGAGL